MLNLVSIYTNSGDTSMNTNILKAFLSFNFKIHSINTLFTRTSELDDEAIIRLILEEYNSIQIFIILNCKLSYKININQFFGYQFKKEDLKEKNIDGFFMDIYSTVKFGIVHYL